MFTMFKLRENFDKRNCREFNKCLFFLIEFFMKSFLYNNHTRNMLRSKIIRKCSNFKSIATSGKI